MTKTNPIPARLVPTVWSRTIIPKKFLYYIVKVLNSCQASQPRDLKKGPGIPQGIWPSGPEGFDYRPPDWGTDP